MKEKLQEQLRAELARQGLTWKASPDYDDQLKSQIQWLPVVNLTAARIELGLSSDGHWVVAAPQSVWAFTPDKSCVFLLPLLEVEPDEARRLLKRGLEANGLSAEFLKVFPFEAVVATGLESHSERWTSLALKWAEQLPASLKLQSALQTLRTGGPTQKIRHAAQKLLARQSGTEDKQR